VGRIALDIPAAAGSAKTLDLYGWDGANWSFVPSEIDSAANQIVSLEGALPQAVAMMQAAAPESPVVGAELLPTQEFAADLLPLFSEVTAGTLTLAGTGELQGELTAVPTGSYSQLMRVTNTGAIIDQVSLTALLNDAAAQTAHINTLAAQAKAGNFAGVNLDYQGVAANQTAAFTTFVTNLANALHNQGMTLAVTLGTPLAANTTWDTGGQDWAALGQAADAVYVQMPLDPTAYTDGGGAEQLLAWATRQIERQKLTMLVTNNAIDRIGESFREMANSAALDNFGELQFVQGGEEVEPETAVEVALSGAASPLEWDGASLTYKYSYDMSGQMHHVWLGNEAALAYRLRLAQAYNLRGVAVRGLGNVDNGAGYAAAINSFLGTGAGPQPTGAAIVWTVTAGENNVLASASGEELSFAWEGVAEPGAYQVNAEFALGENVASLGSLTVNVMEPEPVVEATPEEDTAVTPNEGESTTAGETEATPTPPPSFSPGDADAVTNVNANVRQGPGLGYGTLAGGASAGTQVELIGRSSDSSWMNVRLPDGQEGWIFTSLLTINSSVSVSALPVVEVDPPVASNGDDNTPPPVVVPPVANSGFELGGQAFGAPYGMMSYAGMRWVKKQHKWGPGQNGNVVAGLIAEAHNAGFKILLSIPGADHSSIDYNAYVTFLSQVAGLPDPPDAIEVWNEMNIDREWPAGQISPATYVNNMLAPAYNAIKAASPGTMVISGAPAPTGFFGGCGGGGCDDNLYMAGIAGAGGASYMDCIGIHYNEGIISPNQQSGDPRNPSNHYSRYFWGMVNTYYNAFGGARPLCFTELGYLTPEGFGGLPGDFAWAGNVTVAQQAQW
ncbi:MAG: SH3 domain-containing protein, partial [Anaerolineae bacterium]